ncbi:MAG: alpha/beta hydrolase [Lentisphaeria bacterium]|nr:alpha/beta hydrolase [Lentisphaeria bacterium]
MIELKHGVPSPLWDGIVPLGHGDQIKVDLPTITPYFPPVWKANRKAIVILPGGAYALYGEHEGGGYAEYFANLGYHCFVVHYRLGSNKYHHPAEISDAARGIRLVRSLAKDLNLREDCIGIMGSSAGGHLAASLANMYEQALIAEDEGETGKISSRPDWQILCYPVITGGKFANKPSFQYLLGEDYTEENAIRMGQENNVNANTPPAFIWHTMEDTAVPVENSIMYAQALREQNIPFELHIYQKGPHGRGLFQGHQWAQECERWLATF